MALKNDLMENRTDFSGKPVTNADYMIRQEQTESNRSEEHTSELQSR